MPDLLTLLAFLISGLPMTELKDFTPPKLYYDVALLFAGYLLSKLLSGAEARFKRLPTWWRSRSARSRAKRVAELRPKARYLRTLARSGNRRALLRADADRLTHNALMLLFGIFAFPLVYSRSSQDDRWLGLASLLAFVVFVEVWKWPRDERYMLYRAEKLVVRREAFELNNALRARDLIDATGKAASLIR